MVPFKNDLSGRKIGVSAKTDHSKMSRINPLRKLYNYLSERLSEDEERQLRNLLRNVQLTTRELESLKGSAEIFNRLEELGRIYETNLGLLKDLLESIHRQPLVREVERVEKELEERRLERVSDDLKVKSTDTQFSAGGDVTASSEISSAAVHREMDRTMEDPEGEPTSLQHHIDNHSLHHTQHIPATTVQPKIQLEVQEQAGDNSGSPPSKRRKGSAELLRPSESKYPDVVLRCERELKSLYENLSEILPFPWWDGTNRLKLENVYTELELETKKGEKRDFPRRDIFSSKTDEESRKTPKRVLIEGDPGYGKSTFCKQLINDWAKGNAEYLNCFKLMFHFEIRDLLFSEAQTILDAIFDKLLCKRNVMDESVKPELWKFIQSNQAKVCFVFDGLDEVSTKDLPPYFKDMITGNCILPHCPLIVTSRKIRDKNSKQMYNTHLSIKGFDYDKAKKFIQKHMDEMNSQGYTEVTASDFLQEVEKSHYKHVLIDFMQSPLNTLLLSEIWIRSSKLPNTRTKLYEEIVDYVVNRYRENHDCNSYFEEEIKQALILMEKMSYEGLTTQERKVYFSEEYISHNHNRYIRELGLLTKVSEFPPRYGFFHLTFQEYFASMYVARLLTEDRCKFIDAITLLCQGTYFEYDTLFAFIGGKLQNDHVEEIFKVMQEERIYPNSYFDPREILYESCCTSTAVFEQCAEFMPERLTVDLDTMVSQADNNRLNLNTAILQCPRLRSTEVTFKLSTKNADTEEMYRLCYEALQKNGKKLKSINVSLTIDMNDFKGKGRGYVDKFTFINNSQRHSLTDLEPLNMDRIAVKISKRVKSPIAFNDSQVTAILKSLSPVSANFLSIKDLPLESLETIKGVIGFLSGNKIKSHIFMDCFVGYSEYWSTSLLNITAFFGKFLINFRMNEMEFRLIDLHEMLLTFASVHDMKLSLCIEFHFELNTKIVADITDMLYRFGSVDIDTLRIEIKGVSGLNKEEICRSISEITEAMSEVSVKRFEINGLPAGSLEFMREVFHYMYCNKLIRYISIVFGGRFVFPDMLKKDQIYTAIQVGKITIRYVSKTMDFSLADLHRSISTFVAVENESVSLGVEIGSNLSEKTKSEMADLRSLPLGNLEFIKDALGYLSNEELMRNVYIKCDDILPKAELRLVIDSTKFQVHYKMNTMDFKSTDRNELFPTSLSGNERVSPDLSLRYSLNDKMKVDIPDMLCKLASVEIGRLILTIRIYVDDSKWKEIYFHIANMVTALSRLSVNKLELVIKGLPVKNLEFVRDVSGCLISCKIPMSVIMIFCDDGLRFWEGGKFEIYARVGKFQFVWKMNNMDFNLLSLRRSLTEYVSMDNNSITFAVRVNHDLSESTNTELTEIFETFVSVDIAKMSLYMSYDTTVEIEDVYSRTSDMLRSLSLIDAKSLVIKGLPCGDIEFIKSVHTDVEKSVPDKVTHISFGPSYSPKYGIMSSKHSTLTAKNQKHTRDFDIPDLKLDIVSLYHELQEEFFTHDQRFLMDAQIKCTSNIEDDIRYILGGSKRITFDMIEYVEGSDNLSPAIDVLEKLAELNTKQFSYKSNKSFDYELTKSVVDAILQCQSAETVVISSDEQCDDIKISENIEKLANNGIIIHGVQLFGRKLAIQGKYVEETNKLSKVIEVEFTLNSKSDIDFGFDNSTVSRSILHDGNAVLYMKLFNSLQTIAEHKSLSIGLHVILSTEFQTFYSCEFTIENIAVCISALRCLTRVRIVGGKITATDNSTEQWTDLCSKESLQMLTFEGCDLNSSCQSVIDSFDKADERRCNKLKIILCDALCLQHMNLMKDLLLSKSFDLIDACESVSQGNTVFSLEGKSVIIIASLRAKEELK